MLFLNIWKNFKSLCWVPFLNICLVQIIKNWNAKCSWKFFETLSLSEWRSLTYRNQSIYLQSKSMDWFVYNWNLRLERVKASNCRNTMEYHSQNVSTICWSWLPEVLESNLPCFQLLLTPALLLRLDFER